MKVIPVIDLLDGKVVHAIAGNRKSYRPFSHSRFRCTDPVELAQQLKREFTSAPLYLADLDAIQGRDPQLDLVRRMLTIDGCFLIDFGLKNPEELITVQTRLTEFTNWKAILASETVSDLSSFFRLPGFDPCNYFFSIDIRNSKVVTKGRFIYEELTAESCPSAWIDKLSDLGFQDLILMDLDAVGSGGHIQNHRSGSCENLEDVRIFAAGGVQSAEDLNELDDLGYSGALVATAIHSGMIRGDSLKDPE